MLQEGFSREDTGRGEQYTFSTSPALHKSEHTKFSTHHAAALKQNTALRTRRDQQSLTCQEGSTKT